LTSSSLISTKEKEVKVLQRFPATSLLLRDLSCGRVKSAHRPGFFSTIFLSLARVPKKEETYDLVSTTRPAGFFLYLTVNLFLGLEKDIVDG